MLGNRSLIGLFVAEIVSLTGSSMTLLALPWFVLATTGSASKMGWVLAARLAPQALFGIPAGSLVARLGAKRTMLVSDAARGPLMAIIPILWWTGHLSFAALLAAMFAAGYALGHVSINLVFFTIAAALTVSGIAFSFLCYVTVLRRTSLRCLTSRTARRSVSPIRCRWSSARSTAPALPSP